MVNEVKQTETYNEQDTSVPLDTKIDIESAIEQFSTVIGNELGADVEPEPDGTIHRFHDPDGKPNNQDGWYYFDETAAEGIFGSWRREGKLRWISPDFNALSEAARGSITERIHAVQAQNAMARKQRQDEVALKAEAKYNNARPANSHPYLKTKGISAGVAHHSGNKVLIPMRNIAGDIRNVQSISPKGNKRFMARAEVTGNFALIGDLPTSGVLHIVEGYATAMTVHKEFSTPVAAAMNAGNLISVAEALREHLPDEIAIVIAADDDRDNPENPGLTKAMAAAAKIGATVIAPNFTCEDCKCSDFNDVALCKARDKDMPLFREVDTNDAGQPDGKPQSLVSELPSVKPMVEAMLPKSIVGFVSDVSTRLQIPPDYVAVAAITIIAGVVGAKCGIHPKQRDDWLVIPTLWAGLVGPPSTMKSPALSEARKPLDELERELSKAYTEALTYFGVDQKLAEANLKSVEKDALKMYVKTPDKARQKVLDATPSEPKPVRQRYQVNDATVEKLGEIMSENPNGLILIRDELSGTIAKLSKEEHQGERAFFLECFNGNGPFTWDRIGRGTVEIANCTLSICGGIQPSKLDSLIRGAIDGSADDGLIQRFQLAVWPDTKGSWEWRDEKPDRKSYERYRSVVRAMHELLPADHKRHPRFTNKAQALYQKWMENLQAKIRQGDLHPTVQSHLLKMPKTIASLALLFELMGGGRASVGKNSTTMALLWADYLESHAIRLYSMASTRAMDAAQLIHKRRHKLPVVFTVRNIYRHGWAGLSTTVAVEDALDILIEYGHVTEVTATHKKVVGRPKDEYRWHASLTKKS